ncbi:hypothetical protein B2J86_14840 [Acidovorax sp. SRB_14]|nr:hypothetical protein [Acidovorax sp. SRB_24]NMM82188.1 hypothetical protein [Acidovorax sp. SRB_14]NMM87737.1 hypothetical protein [Rhodococcus sp. SRB_17]
MEQLMAQQAAALGAATRASKPHHGLDETARGASAHPAAHAPAGMVRPDGSDKVVGRPPHASPAAALSGMSAEWVRRLRPIAIAWPWLVAFQALALFAWGRGSLWALLATALAGWGVRSAQALLARLQSRSPVHAPMDIAVAIDRLQQRLRERTRHAAKTPTSHEN